ncbi:MAG: HNH endonuclease signature motif containing protein [Minisyncoccia bacterium]
MGYQHSQWVKDWKSGERDGNIGITARNFSKHLKIYLVEKFNNKCCICGWNKKHPITGVVPIEIDHIDGNSENNVENNLRLICPNCHALTPFYKNMNRGKGRKWRMDKYIKNSRLT